MMKLIGFHYQEHSVFAWPPGGFYLPRLALPPTFHIPFVTCPGLNEAKALWEEVGHQE